MGALFGLAVLSPLGRIAHVFELCYTNAEAARVREKRVNIPPVRREVEAIDGQPSSQAEVQRMSIRFQWDPQKAARNATRRAVTFEEAATVFQDALALIFDDEEHSVDEHREIIIGHSKQGQLLVAAFTEREDVIRIISARKADRQEREDYENARR